LAETADVFGVSNVFLPKISGLGGYDPERGAKVAGDGDLSRVDGGWGWIKLDRYFVGKKHEDIYQMKPW